MSKRRPNTLPGYVHRAGEPLPGADLIRLMAQHTDTVVLSFSAGKDAIAAWLALKPHFRRIIPVYLYLVPGLEFVEDGLAYYEQVFGTPIIRLPNPSLYRMLKANVFQPPERWPLIQQFGIGTITHDDVFSLLLEDLQLPADTFVATGVRAADSPNRRSSIYKHGPVTLKRRPPVFHPVWDMKKDELVSLIRDSGVKLTVDYSLWGRSWDGIDLRFIYPLREHFPDDYARVLEWFPLCDLEIFRYECHLRHKQQDMV